MNMELKLFSKINSEEENEAALARISELMDIDEKLISQKKLDELDSKWLTWVVTERNMFWT